MSGVDWLIVLAAVSLFVSVLVGDQLRRMDDREGQQARERRRDRDLREEARRATVTLADPVALGPPDFVRDQWHRPLIIPPEGGNPRPYVRASSAAKTVEDTFNLELWARRNVAFGMARDKSLIARVLALGGDPSTWDLATKKSCNAIVEDASAVALAHRAADIGTAVHRMTEMLDRGQPVDAGPYEADLTAYANTLIEHGLIVVEIECRLVCDDLEMAGTADRILQRTSDRMHLIADVKTGETVDYGGLGWAAQLAAYAHSDFYDPDSGERTSTPALDQTVGIIVHLPAGRETCTLYEIDLVAGYRAATLANEIRAVRRQAKRWIALLTGSAATTGEATRPATAIASPLSPGEAASAVADLSSVTADVRRSALRDRYNALDGKRQVAFRARGIAPENLDAIEHALDTLEPHPVDVDRLASPEVAALNERLLGVTPEHKAWLDAVARQALAGPGSISFRYEPFERNLALCSALLNCCAAGLDDDDLRVLLEAVIGDEVQQSIPTGAALGTLTLAEARRLDEMAQAAIP